MPPPLSSLGWLLLSNQRLQVLQSSELLCDVLNAHVAGHNSHLCALWVFLECLPMRHSAGGGGAGDGGASFSLFAVLSSVLKISIKICRGLTVFSCCHHRRKHWGVGRHRVRAFSLVAQQCHHGEYGYTLETLTDIAGGRLIEVIFPLMTWSLDCRLGRLRSKHVPCLLAGFKCSHF